MKRRDFLKVTGAGAAGVFVPRAGRTAPFGEFPSGHTGLLLPESVRAKRVLEIFLYGGLSPWETLYFVEGHGQANNEQLYAFDLTNARSLCGIAGESIGEDFATDADGQMVKLGPFSIPLRNRPDVTDRMRLLVQRHDLEPHEAAIPLALSGKRIGSPSLAGLGAHVQRYFVDRPETGRASPYGYAFVSSSIPGDNVQAAAAIGLHPGAARPLTIRLGEEDSRFLSLLARNEVGTGTPRAQYDAAVDAYVERYRNRLRFRGEGAALRSSRLSSLSYASETVTGSDAIRTVLGSTPFATSNDTVCGGLNANVPRMSLELAVRLLTHATEPARYCCVVDTGLLEADGGGGYDGHGEVTETTARNFTNVLTYLLDNVSLPGAPEAGKLDLDDTLIILNTEFGRTPWAQDNGDGRNHHPYGYVTALIGGPITSAQKGVVGAIDDTGVAQAGKYVTCSEARIAALLSLGIWPFSPEAFFVSDVQNAISEAGAVESVTERLLGYTL